MDWVTTTADSKRDPNTLSRVSSPELLQELFKNHRSGFILIILMVHISFVKIILIKWVPWTIFFTVRTGNWHMRFEESGSQLFYVYSFSLTLYFLNDQYFILKYIKAFESETPLLCSLFVFLTEVLMSRAILTRFLGMSSPRGRQNLTFQLT